jgi:hypothetical protein
LRLPMKPTCIAIHGMPEGEIGATRVVRFIADAPPYGHARGCGT